MHPPPTRFVLGLNALALAACSASSTAKTPATDRGRHAPDAAYQADLDAASPDASEADTARETLPEGYVTCILNELANETYACLADSVVENYESCTIL